MGDPRPTTPTAALIVVAQSALLTELGINGPRTHCWACRANSSLQRAHIVAFSDGGSNKPTNFFLLCWECHREQPDCASREVQLEWLKTHESEIGIALRVIATGIEAMKQDVSAEGRETLIAEWFSIIGEGGMRYILTSRLTTGGRGARDAFRLATLMTLRTAFRQWIEAEKDKAVARGFHCPQP